MIPQRARVEDAKALAATHVQAWRETYAGLMPEGLLARLDARPRARRWRRMIGNGDCVRLVRDGGGIVGFGAAGPQRHPALPYGGEVGALYVLRRAQRHGLGRALLAALAQDLAARGFTGMSLWVLDGNLPARRFYEAMGGHAVRSESLAHDGWMLDHTAYAWDDVTLLFPGGPGQRGAARL